VLILDPADQLVMDLRSVIDELKSDNKRLSSQMDRLVREGIVPASAGAASAGGGTSRRGKEERGANNSFTRAYASVPGGALGGGSHGGGGGVGSRGGPKKKKVVGSKTNVLTLGPYPDINVRSSHSDRAYGGGVGPTLSLKLKRTPKLGGGGGGGGGMKSARGGANDPGPVTLSWSKANGGHGGGRSGSGSGGGDSPRESGGSHAPLDFSDFPELAALEAQFQSHMTTVKTGADPTWESAADASSDSPSDTEAAAAAATAEGPPASATPTQTDTAAAVVVTDSAPAPEEAAVDWAGKNRWFGRDQEMTQYAYQIHDVLVEAEGVDPSSPVYYEELDARTRDRFGDARVDGMGLEAPGTGTGVPGRKKKAANELLGTFGKGSRFGAGAGAGAAAGAGAGARAGAEAGRIRGVGVAGGGAGAGTVQRKATSTSTRVLPFAGSSTSIAERMAAQVSAEIARRVSTSSCSHGRRLQAWNAGVESQSSLEQGQGPSSSSSNPNPSAARTSLSSPRLAPSRARGSGHGPPAGAAVSSSLVSLPQSLSLRDSATNQYGVSFDQQYSGQPSSSSSSSSNAFDKSSRETYLARRREIIKELQMAKAEAEAEHRRLYEKIKFTLDGRPQAAFT
jgi:hypothetical protein